MEDVFLLLFLGSVGGLTAAGVVSLWDRGKMSLRTGIGSMLAAYVGEVALANYVVATSRFIHRLDRFPPTPTVLAELACAVIAFPIGLRFWPWLKTKRKVESR